MYKQDLEFRGGEGRGDIKQSTYRVSMEQGAYIIFFHTGQDFCGFS